ncbi:MAG TPA: hypothetical protein VF092_06585 [Longimicrobium sp.]
MKRVLRLPLLTIAVTALAACGGRMAQCDPADVDTSGWREVTSRYRTFALTLPPAAREDSVFCMDSACGVIHVGRWNLRYDMGRMAGPGDSVPGVLGATDVRFCAVTLAGRPGHMMSGRMPASRGYPRGRDRVARAALPLGEEEGGLYFIADSLSERDAAEFAAAVRTLRLIPYTPPPTR